MGPSPAGLQQIQNILDRIISSIVGLGLVAMFVMITYAGYKYLRSGGDPKSLEAARMTIVWALLGMVFMAVGWLILKLIETATGVQVTSFNIGTLCNFGGTDWCIKK